MMQAEIQAFKSKIQAKMKDKSIDHTKPYRKSKRLEIVVSERENGKANVGLFYSMRFARMFGQNDMVWHDVMQDAEMKAACHAAKELKKLLPTFKIVFNEYEEEIF